MSTVIPLPRKPAYTPMGDPVKCQTPEHEDEPARPYPGGRLCGRCVVAAGEARKATSSSDEKGAAA